jgi:hypothetical protein
MVGAENQRDANARLTAPYGHSNVGHLTVSARKNNCSNEKEEHNHPETPGLDRIARTLHSHSTLKKN